MKTFRGRPVSGNFAWLTTIDVKNKSLVQFPDRIRSMTEPIKGICRVSFWNGGSFVCKIDDLNSITTTPMMLNNIMRI